MKTPTIKVISSASIEQRQGCPTVQKYCQGNTWNDRVFRQGKWVSVSELNANAPVNR